jgi:hypothetical protein
VSSEQIVVFPATCIDSRLTRPDDEQAFLYADSEDRYKSLPTLTVGFIFLGSHLRGTKAQFLADLVAKIMSPAGSHRGIVSDLAYDEPALLDKLHSFCRLRNKLLIPVSCFFELYETDYGKRFGLGGIAKGMVCRVDQQLNLMSTLALTDIRS